MHFVTAVAHDSEVVADVEHVVSGNVAVGSEESIEATRRLWGTRPRTKGVAYTHAHEPKGLHTRARTKGVAFGVFRIQEKGEGGV